MSLDRRNRELAQQLRIEAGVQSRTLGDGQNDLPMRDGKTDFFGNVNGGPMPGLALLCFPNIRPTEIILINAIDLKTIHTRFKKALSILTNFGTVMFLRISECIERRDNERSIFLYWFYKIDRPGFRNTKPIKAMILTRHHVQFDHVITMGSGQFNCHLGAFRRTCHNHTATMGNQEWSAGTDLCRVPYINKFGNWGNLEGHSLRRMFLSPRGKNNSRHQKRSETQSNEVFKIRGFIRPN